MAGRGRWQRKSPTKEYGGLVWAAYADGIGNVHMRASHLAYEAPNLVYWSIPLVPPQPPKPRRRRR